MGTSNIAVRAEISSIPMRIRASAQILKFYYRIILGSVNELLKQTFQNIVNISINPYSQFLTLLADCDIPLRERAGLLYYMYK